MNTIEEKVLAITRKLAQDDQIAVNTALLDDGIIDSLTTIELISTLESEFSVSIGADDLNHHNFNTVQNITALINDKLK